MGNNKKTREQIHAIFYPESVAVIGANNVKGSVPFDIFNNILKDDFKGMLFPVSPRERSICSVKTYKYITDIPDDVDMGVLVFPSSVANLAMEQCGQKGIKSMIIISAGFREVGGKGIEREKMVKDIADKYGISYIGPNCLGVINTDPVCHFNASFARKMPRQGDIAFLSQSGALCTAVLDYAEAKNIGFSKFVSFGNKGDVDEVDLINYLKDDPLTKVILLYLEEVTDGPALMKAAKDVIKETGKPVLILKSGRTHEGALAASSHTGSLAGSDDICDAAFEQAGIIRCDDIEQMFNYATALAWREVPKGRRTAIITNAGGPGVLATDMVVTQGLTLAKFSEETTAILKKALPATANIKNPVDVIGDARADRYDTAINAIMADENVDSVGVILTPQSMTDIDDIAEGIIEDAAHFTKTLYTSFMGEADVGSGFRKLLGHKIPHYSLPENMCRSLAVATKFNETRQRVVEAVPPPPLKTSESCKRSFQEALAAGKVSLTESESIEFLKDSGLSLPQHKLVTRKTDLESALTDFNFPVVMKIMSPDILHKTDCGGVKLNINNKQEAAKAWDDIMRSVKDVHPEADIDGILIEDMVDPGMEVIIGVKRDPSFGPVIMFGMGGIHVELYKDVIFRVAPLTSADCDKMVNGIKASKLLKGFRGSLPMDLDALKKTLLTISDLAVSVPEISELDINPLILYPEGKGCCVADINIQLKKEG
jgi:acetyltransferase